jgi:hypothetical protein
LKNRRAFAVSVLSLSILLLLGYYLIFPYSTYFYRSTKDTATNPHPWRDYLQVGGRGGLLLKHPQDFVVKGDTIYLLARRTSSLPLFMAVLRHEDKVWSVDELNTLSSNHEDLKPLWPDPKAKNLGVQWVSAGEK